MDTAASKVPPLHGLQLSVSQPENDEAKRTKKRATAARELYDTEVTYVRSLMVLINGFMVPCKNENILTKQEISEVFSNVAQLLTFHKDFLKDLKERIDIWTDDTAIGDIVLSVTPYMKLYTAYGSNYENALNAVQNLSKKNQRFAQFLETCMQTPSFGGLTLSAYLIMPIQRIPRYRMLLEVLVKFTPQDHSDFKHLNEALEVVRDVANYINTHIAKEDNTRHLIRIQNLVPKQQILSPMRRFIMEASFPTNYFAKTKKSSKRLESGRSKSLRLNHNEKENKGRHSLSSSSLRALEKDAGFVQAHFYLFDDALVLQSTKEKTKSAFLHLTTMWSITQPDLGCVLELVTLETTFVIVTGNEDEQKEWAEALTLAINSRAAINADERGLREQFVLRRCHGDWRAVPALSALSQSDAGAAPDAGADEEDVKALQKKKARGKGGLLVISQGPQLSPRARSAALTRNLSTSSILAQMKENATS